MSHVGKRKKKRTSRAARIYIKIHSFGSEKKSKERHKKKEEFPNVSSSIEGMIDNEVSAGSCLASCFRRPSMN